MVDQIWPLPPLCVKHVLLEGTTCGPLHISSRVVIYLRFCGSQRIKYFLPGPLQQMCANPCSGPETCQG